MGKPSEQKVATAIDWIMVGTAVAPTVVDTLKNLFLALTSGITDEELNKKMDEAMTRIEWRNTEIQRKGQQPVPTP